MTVLEEKLKESNKKLKEFSEESKEKIKEISKEISNEIKEISMESREKLMEISNEIKERSMESKEKLEKMSMESKEKLKEISMESKEKLKEISKEFKEISSHMKIDWAPIDVPPRRRIQTLAAAFYVYVFMFLPFISLFLTAFFLLYLNYLGRALLLVYLTYIYFDHTKRASALDGNGWKFLRNNFMAHHLRDYFPIELIKTAELTPDRNYLVVSFPHGIIGTGVTNNMGNNIGKWLKLYPGIRPKIATLDMHFRIPFLREVVRLWGLVSCSKQSLMYYLNKSNDPKHPDNRDGFTSNAVALLVGGAEESLESHPGRYVLVLKERKGFVKIAIRSGTPIVPSFSFGEVDIFDQVANPPDSMLRKFQTFVKHLTGVSPLIVLGRGLFQYTFGLLPHRRHIVQVVGAPIEVKKMDEPDTKYVNEIHQKVIDSLYEMFEKYKYQYIQNAEETKLVIR
ncbi:diacylglycerol O-acyltransferase 2-like [Musca autumnalis]|uniref:diacylglycerol O-acyltransferase 2-like n=1 Tax=Musca autumnalis TaxID=221902 RepID=UPI003CF96643